MFASQSLVLSGLGRLDLHQTARLMHQIHKIRAGRELGLTILHKKNTFNASFAHFTRVEANIVRVHVRESQSPHVFAYVFTYTFKIARV